MNTLERIIILSNERTSMQDNYRDYSINEYKIRMFSINEALQFLWAKRRREIHNAKIGVRRERSKYRATA